MGKWNAIFAHLHSGRLLSVLEHTDTRGARFQHLIHSVVHLESISVRRACCSHVARHHVSLEVER